MAAVQAQGSPRATGAKPANGVFSEKPQFFHVKQVFRKNGRAWGPPSALGNRFPRENAGRFPQETPGGFRDFKKTCAGAEPPHPPVTL